MGCSNGILTERKVCLRKYMKNVRTSTGLNDVFLRSSMIGRASSRAASASQKLTTDKAVTWEQPLTLNCPKFAHFFAVVDASLSEI